MSGDWLGEVPTACERVYKSLLQCHRRVPIGVRETTCRHLNRSLAECMISYICPNQSEAVKNLCGPNHNNNSGTALKRSQCQQAQISLATCISFHQQPGPLR
uniref:uncharacterized protein LOC122579256 n=1 Tax=Erigeron canadensis TaxID=72917 RepID=UPI001CB966F1|nr:uncharacterized protein LOC122579256 [Erigeron canadensis]